MILIFWLSLLMVLWGFYKGPIFGIRNYFNQNMERINHHMFFLTAVAAALGIVGLVFSMLSLSGILPHAQ
jgi:uncharacterized membrane protein